MDKRKLAGLIDAYADAKTSGNKILIQKMVEELEQTLNVLFPEEVSAPGAE